MVSATREVAPRLEAVEAAGKWGWFMEHKAIAWFVVAAVGLFFFFTELRSKPQPPSRVFRCSRCGTAARHDERTTSAWRKGEAGLSCQTCHAQWLQSCPPQERESSIRPVASAVLSVLMILAGFYMLYRSWELESHYLHTRPKTPDPAQGHVHRFTSHRSVSTVYLSRADSWTLLGLWPGGFVLIIAGGGLLRRSMRSQDDGSSGR